MLHIFWFTFEIEVSNTQTSFLMYALSFAACSGRKIQLGIRVFWIKIQNFFPLGLCIAPWGSSNEHPDPFILESNPPEYYPYCMNHHIIMAIDFIQQYFIHQLVLIFCSLRSKRFQSSYCAKVRAGAKKKKVEGGGGGFLHSLPPPPSFLFLLSSQLSRQTREETLATQAIYFVSWYITTWISSW